MKTSEQLQEMASKVAKAWQKVQSLKRPAHQAEGCQVDLDAEDQALRDYQALQNAYTRAIREANL